MLIVPGYRRHVSVQMTDTGWRARSSVLVVRRTCTYLRRPVGVSNSYFQPRWLHAITSSIAERSSDNNETRIDFGSRRAQTRSVP